MRIDLFASIIVVQFLLLIHSLPSAPHAWLAPARNGAVKRALNYPSNNPTLQLLNATQTPPISSLLHEIPYNVDGTPVSLHITLRDPPIPALYLNAFFTTVLRQIAPNVRTQGDALVPNNRFMYVDKMTTVGFAYSGFSDVDRLTWQMLSWTLEGLLRFVNQKEENCWGMMVRVDIEEQGAHWSPISGALILRYNGYQGNGSRGEA